MIDNGNFTLDLSCDVTRIGPAYGGHLANPFVRNILILQLHAQHVAGDKPPAGRSFELSILNSQPTFLTALANRTKAFDTG